MPDFGEANDSFAGAFVRSLANAGVQHACVTPGSRSTPLTVALARQSAIRPWLHLDERSSGFFALGIARATGRPVALVCTSGTAAANYYPAVVEASLSRIPLIVCTADRPPRLRDIGADQTMNQAGMYGSNARWTADLPLPFGAPGEASQARLYATRAVRESVNPLPGPVHLNFPFDEPLMAATEPAPAAASPLPRFEAACIEPPDTDVATAAEALSRCRRPLIVAGPESGGLPAASIAALAAALDAPILADPLSGLRAGPHDRSRVLDSYDAVLRAPSLPGLAPDCVLRFGAKPTSKALNQFLARQSAATHILCDRPGSWRDPDALGTILLQGTNDRCATALERAIGTQRSEPAWTAGWLAVDEAARGAMTDAALGFREPFEGRVILELQQIVPEGATIFAGNSMPVRDLDSFFFGDTKPLSLIANRGAAGIDGVTSSALGTAAAGPGPVVLVIGDLSFYHDMNGLWAAARHGLDLTVVLVNNNGGGIFHYLPQAAHASVFEEWFGTPTNLDFSHAVRMYGGEFASLDSWDDFRKSLKSGPGHGLRVVELRTDRVRNAAMHREAWAAAARAILAQPVS